MGKYSALHLLFVIVFGKLTFIMLLIGEMTVWRFRYVFSYKNCGSKKCDYCSAFKEPIGILSYEYTIYTIQCACSLLNVTQNISIQWHDLNGVFKRSLGIRKYTFFDDFYVFRLFFECHTIQIEFWL